MIKKKKRTEMNIQRFLFGFLFLSLYVVVFHQIYLCVGHPHPRGFHYPFLFVRFLFGKVFLEFLFKKKKILEQKKIEDSTFLSQNIFRILVLPVQ